MQYFYKRDVHSSHKALNNQTYKMFFPDFDICINARRVNIGWLILAHHRIPGEVSVIDIILDIISIVKL